MTTRAKFRCIGVTKRTGNNYAGSPEFVYEAEFTAVYGKDGGEENEAFFAATPSGGIKLTTVREDHFEVGKFYYVDFSQAA